MEKLTYSAFIKSFIDKLNEKASKDSYLVEAIGVKVQDARYTLLNLTRDSKNEGRELNALVPYLIYFNTEDMDSTITETYELLTKTRKEYSSKLISKINPDILYEYIFLIKSEAVPGSLVVKSKDGNLNRLYFLMPGDFDDVPDSQKARNSIVTKEMVDLLGMDPVVAIKCASMNTTLLAQIMKKNKESK